MSTCSVWLSPFDPFVTRHSVCNQPPPPLLLANCIIQTENTNYTINQIELNLLIWCCCCSNSSGNVSTLFWFSLARLGSAWLDLLFLYHCASIGGKCFRFWNYNNGDGGDDDGDDDDDGKNDGINESVEYSRGKLAPKINWKSLKSIEMNCTFLVSFFFSPNGVSNQPLGNIRCMVGRNLCFIVCVI